MYSVAPDEPWQPAEAGAALWPFLLDTLEAVAQMPSRLDWVSGFVRLSQPVVIGQSAQVVLQAQQMDRGFVLPLSLDSPPLAALLAAVQDQFAASDEAPARLTSRNGGRDVASESPVPETIIAGQPREPGTGSQGQGGEPLTVHITGSPYGPNWAYCAIYDLCLVRSEQADSLLPEQVVWIPEFVSLSGSRLYARDHEPHDVDLLLRAAAMGPDTFQLPVDASIGLKIRRLLELVYNAAGVQYAVAGGMEAGGQDEVTSRPPLREVRRDVTSEAATSLYDLALVQRPFLEVRFPFEEQFVNLAYKGLSQDKKALTPNALQRRLRGSTMKMRRQAMQSLKEDRVVPGRFFMPLKPMRPAEPGTRQLFNNFLDFVDGLDNWPVFVSPKRDGMRCQIHRTGDQVLIYSDDGANNSDKMPALRQRLEKFGQGDWIIDCEIEAWQGGAHLPREAVAGAIHSGQDSESLVANIFEVLFWDGQDLHARPFADHWAFMKSLPVDATTGGRLYPEKGQQVNLVPHVKVSSREELSREALKMAYQPGVEGVVVKMANKGYPLDGEPGNPPNVATVKWHKSCPLVVVAVAEIPTKVEGTKNYWYGIPLD